MRLLSLMREHALEVLSPTRCAGCEHPGTLICSACLERFRLIDPVLSCTHCGAPFGSLLCTECRGVQPLADRVLVCATYEEPLSRIIRAYKDAGERRLAWQFAELLLDTAQHAEDEAEARFGGILSKADAIAFVPDTARAFTRRGFDHMEEIARVLSRLSGVPVLDALIKHGNGDQRRLGRSERMEAGKNCYELVCNVVGLRLLLLDDVITTGATILAAATALKDDGAASVDALALARVWT